MTDLSQPWCMIPTEPASDRAPQAPAAVDESNAKTMAALTNVAIEGEKDEIYYWDTVKFLVEGSIFKVPRYQFLIGSTYFAEKLKSTKASNSEGDEAPVTLEGATASQFRVLLKLLFPIHTTSTTLKFSKEEWLVILELSTLWHFHEFRKLAKDHLEPQLDDPIERIVLGRAAYTPKWVLDGYETLITRSECISERESERIGHLTTVRLYILRHEQCFKSFTSRFGEEIHALEKMERDHMCAEEKRIEEEKRLEEERLRRDREETQRLKEEKAEAEREEKKQKEREEHDRLAAEEKKRQEEARKKAEEEQLEQECVAEERKCKEEEEDERLQKEADERIQKREEELRPEEKRTAKELADFEKQEKEARLQEEKEREEREEEEKRQEERARKEREEGRKRQEEELGREQEQRTQEREEREHVQKAEREQLQQQSKGTSLGGFGSTWGGKATSFANSLFGGTTLEEPPQPPSQPWLDNKQDVNESPIEWGTLGPKEKPSVSSIARSITGPSALSRKPSQHSLCGNAGATSSSEERRMKEEEEQQRRKEERKRKKREWRQKRREMGQRKEEEMQKWGEEQQMNEEEQRRKESEYQREWEEQQRRWEECTREWEEERRRKEG